jgi:hypothetical protein
MRDEADINEYERDLAAKTLSAKQKEWTKKGQASRAKELKRQQDEAAATAAEDQAHTEALAAREAKREMEAADLKELEDKLQPGIVKEAQDRWEQKGRARRLKEEQDKALATAVEDERHTRELALRDAFIKSQTKKRIAEGEVVVDEEAANAAHILDLEMAAGAAHAEKYMGAEDEGAAYGESYSRAVEFLKSTKQADAAPGPAAELAARNKALLSNAREKALKSLKRKRVKPLGEPYAKRHKDQTNPGLV